MKLNSALVIVTSSGGGALPESKLSPDLVASLLSVNIFFASVIVSFDPNARSFRAFKKRLPYDSFTGLSSEFELVESLEYGLHVKVFSFKTELKPNPSLLLEWKFTKLEYFNSQCLLEHTVRLSLNRGLNTWKQNAIVNHLRARR